MEVKKMYISMPISYNEHTIEERYNKVLDYCEQHYPEYDLVFPYDVENGELKSNEETHNYAWFMGKDLLILSECDAIFMSMDWENSLGCRIERDVAKRTNLDIFYYEHF